MVERVTIKYDGVKHEIPISELDLVPNAATDQDILTAVSHHLSISALVEFEVDRYETVWNCRPEAVHGS